MSNKDQQHKCDLCHKTLTIDTGTGDLSTPTGYGWVKLKGKGSNSHVSKWICLECKQDITKPPSDKKDPTRTGEWYWGWGYKRSGNTCLLKIHTNALSFSPDTIGTTYDEKHAKQIVKAMNDIIFPVEKTTHPHGMHVYNCTIHNSPTPRKPGEWYHTFRPEGGFELRHFIQADTEDKTHGLIHKEEIADNIIKLLNATKNEKPSDVETPNLPSTSPHNTWYYLDANSPNGTTTYRIRRYDEFEYQGTIYKAEIADKIVKLLNRQLTPEPTSQETTTPQPTHEPGEWFTQKLKPKNPQLYHYSLRTERDHKPTTPGITHKPDYLLEGYVDSENLANNIVKFMNKDHKSPDTEHPRPHGTFYHEPAPMIVDNHTIKMTDVTTNQGFLNVGTINGIKIVNQITKNLNDNHPNPKITEHEGLWYTKYHEHGYALIQYSQPTNTPDHQRPKPPHHPRTEHGIIYGKEQAEKITYYLNQQLHKPTI